MRDNDRSNGPCDPQAGDAVALFLGLYLGHVLGDFVFQPGRLVVAKRHRETAVVLHTLIVTFATALVLLGSIGRVWPALLLAGIAHFVVEHLTIRARQAPDASNVTVFLLDQALHIVSLAIIAAVGPSIQTQPIIAVWPVSLHWLALACATATVAFGGSILIFEVQVALDRDSSYSDPILTLDLARLYGFVERGGALLASFLSAAPALGLVLFAPRVLSALLGPDGRRRPQLIAAALGVTLCVIGWALVSAVGV